MKTCNKCNAEKIYDDFYKAKANKDGYNNACKECVKKRVKDKYRKEEAKRDYLDIPKIEGMNYCIKCKAYKPLKRFYKHSNYKNGYENTCKDCLKEKDKRRKAIYYQENRERVLNRTLEYGKENRKKKRIYYANYYKENQNRVNEKNRKYNKQNREKMNEYYKEYRKTEKGREVAYNRDLKRRSNKNHVEFTRVDRRKMLDEVNWKCQNCNIKVHDDRKMYNTPDKANIDHIMPISKGGTSEPSNLQVLCKRCNLIKADKVLN